MNKIWMPANRVGRFFLIVILILGLLLRFSHLDRKVYWYDEVFTSLRISGYTTNDIKEQLFNHHLLTIEDLQKYQYPNSETNFIDTIEGLIEEEPQLTPLYFLIARFWIQLFGYSVAAIRILSAIFSFLAFPCLYWLCLELFASPLVAYLAMAIVAVSPFDILYAQEARFYSLWTLTILLSSSAFLQAIRLKTKLSWSVYAVTLVLAFYTQLFSIFVAIAHGVYLLAINGVKISKNIIYYLTSSLIAVILFLPWVWIILFPNNPNLVKINQSWTDRSLSLNSLVSWWIVHINRLYFDIVPTHNRETNFSDFQYPLIVITMAIVLIIIFFSFYFLVRYASKKATLFILFIAGLNAIPIVLRDLIFQDRISSVGRYFIPLYLGINLSIAYLFTTQINSLKNTLNWRRLWSITLVAFIAVEIFSCSVSFPKNSWYTKNYNSSSPEMADLIDRSTKPLIVCSNCNDPRLIGNLLVISYLLQPKVKFLLSSDRPIQTIPDGFSDIFLINNSRKIENALNTRQKFKVVKVFDRPPLGLWKLQQN